MSGTPHLLKNTFESQNYIDLRFDFLCWILMFCEEKYKKNKQPFVDFKPKTKALGSFI